MTASRRNTILTPSATTISTAASSPPSRRNNMAMDIDNPRRRRRRPATWSTITTKKAVVTAAALLTTATMAPPSLSVVTATATKITQSNSYFIMAKKESRHRTTLSSRDSYISDNRNNINIGDYRIRGRKRPRESNDQEYSFLRFLFGQERRRENDGNYVVQSTSRREQKSYNVYLDKNTNSVWDQITLSPAAPTRSPNVEVWFPTNEPTTEPPTPIPPSRSPTPQPITPAPTTKPTPAPTTGRPTRSPTISPTTSRPTTQPTTSPPTMKPTKRPSPMPTSSPTLLPTPAPTIETKLPTTKRPTPIPTKKPTAKPTSTPTSSPTTLRPTKNPTMEPTVSPISSPTTLRPTKNPTMEPTFSPISSPTTMQPTKNPAIEPTSRPIPATTMKPTQTPAIEIPSQMSPIFLPTDAPTTVLPTPTTMPLSATTLPTLKPSVLPSLGPTSLDSRISIPTQLPTAPTTMPVENLETTNPSSTSSSMNETSTPLRVAFEPYDLTVTLNTSNVTVNEVANELDIVLTNHMEQQFRDSYGDSFTSIDLTVTPEKETSSRNMRRRLYVPQDLLFVARRRIQSEDNSGDTQATFDVSGSAEFSSIPDGIDNEDALTSRINNDVETVFDDPELVNVLQSDPNSDVLRSSQDVVSRIQDNGNNNPDGNGGGKSKPSVVEIVFGFFFVGLGLFGLGLYARAGWKKLTKYRKKRKARAMITAGQRQGEGQQKQRPSYLSPQQQQRNKNVICTTPDSNSRAAQNKKSMQQCRGTNVVPVGGKINEDNNVRDDFDESFGVSPNDPLSFSGTESSDSFEKELKKAASLDRRVWDQYEANRNTLVERQHQQQQKNGMINYNGDNATNVNDISYYDATSSAGGEGIETITRIAPLLAAVGPSSHHGNNDDGRLLQSNRRVSASGGYSRTARASYKGIGGVVVPSSSNDNDPYYGAENNNDGNDADDEENSSQASDTWYNGDSLGSYNEEYDNNDSKHAVNGLARSLKAMPARREGSQAKSRVDDENDESSSMPEGDMSTDSASLLTSEVVREVQLLQQFVKKYEKNRDKNKRKSIKNGNSQRGPYSTLHEESANARRGLKSSSIGETSYGVGNNQSDDKTYPIDIDDVSYNKDDDSSSDDDSILPSDINFDDADPANAGVAKGLGIARHPMAKPMTPLSRNSDKANQPASRYQHSATNDITESTVSDTSSNDVARILGDNVRKSSGFVYESNYSYNSTGGNSSRVITPTSLSSLRQVDAIMDIEASDVPDSDYYTDSNANTNVTVKPDIMSRVAAEQQRVNRKLSSLRLSTKN